MSYPKPHLNAARRRARKLTLARRDGRHCTYCRLPFTADLRNATLDHVVPISLFRTWRAEHLVLACRACNETKGNRLPLSIALLLCGVQADDRDAGVTQVSAQMPHTGTPVVMAVTPLPVTPVTEPATGDREHPTQGHEHSAQGREHSADAVHEQSIGRVGEQSGEQSGERVDRPIGEVFTPDWGLLARLAHVHQSAAETALQGRTPLGRKGMQAPDCTPDQSRGELPVRPVRMAVRDRTDRAYGRLVHPVRGCTDRGTDRNRSTSADSGRDGRQVVVPV